MCDFQVYQVLNLYAHVPVFLISIFLAYLVFTLDRKNPINKNLFIFITMFVFWVTNDFLQWIVRDPKTNLFLGRIATLESISLVFLLFFAYAFSGIELSLKRKMFFFLPFLPILALTFTDYNASLVDQAACNIDPGNLVWYVYAILIIYTAWSIKILFVFSKNKTISNEKKHQAKIIMRGIAFVAAWFLLFMALTQISVNYNLPWGDSASMFTPFGMLIFIGFLAYAITKYKFLNIKLLAAQVLTYIIWILIGSQYFFADSLIAYVLISMTFLFSILFGIMLIKSTNGEARRKEQLQQMSDKLAIANDNLRKLDNAKTEFLSIASHQIKTPLTALKGFASLLLENSYGEISSEQKGAVEKMYSSSDQVIQLVEDLLNVSRMESGRMQFAIKKASMTKLLNELYENFILIAKTKKFYLDLKFPEEELPEIPFDYSKVRELVSNFIDNALKYTEKGGVTIKAEKREEGVVVDKKGFVDHNNKSPYGPVLRMTVSDTGIGVPKEEIPYLFKKFSRGKDVSRLHVGGTGLGLYVGKAVAEAHHGQVWVESDGAGKGSRFIIEIPLQQPTV